MRIWVRPAKSGKVKAAGGVSVKPPKDIENWIECISVDEIHGLINKLQKEEKQWTLPTSAP